MRLPQIYGFDVVKRERANGQCQLFQDRVTVSLIQWYHLSLSNNDICCNENIWTQPLIYGANKLIDFGIVPLIWKKEEDGKETMLKCLYQTSFWRSRGCQLDHIYHVSFRKSDIWCNKDVESNRSLCSFVNAKTCRLAFLSINLPYHWGKVIYGVTKMWKVTEVYVAL